MIICLSASTVTYAEENVVINTVKDLHYGEVLFHFFQDDYFTSITHLLAAQQLNRVAHHRPDDELLLGGIELSYGMHHEAGKIFARILEENTDDAVKNRAYYYLAKISYQRGYLAKSAEYVKNIKGAVHEDIFNDVKLLKSQIYLDIGQPEKAIATLDSWKAPKSHKPYALHNLGIAHIRNGNVDDGIDSLKSASKQKVRNSDQLTLRDKSNLVAGLALLKAQPEKAQSYLEDVRLSGLYSDISLLTMGWAHSEQGNYEKALTPWLELKNRRLTTTPVQEGLLAIAYGYGQLGLNGRAVKSYEDALNSYQVESTKLTESIASIEQGKFITALIGKTQEEPLLGWFWSLKSIPSIPEMRYLSELMADHQFHEAVKNFRDLIFLQDNLQHWLDNIHVFNTMLDTRKARYEETAPAAGKTLKRSQLKRLQAKYAELTKTLKNAESNQDVLAFVNDDELLNIKRIERLQYKLTELSEQDPSNEQYIVNLERLKLLKGRIYWNVSQQYAERQWKTKSELKIIEQEITNLADVEKSIGTVDQVASFGFGGFQYRIDEIKLRIEQAMPRLVIAYDKQSKLIEKLAVRELVKRKIVMKSYRAQAKLALAQAYDQATIDNPEIIGDEQ
ncbi:MAG: hypothetical protein R8G33_04215 [Gammaproteobacteria bacterium]|nr:hypothetical protein [Gammaproteobacteria bacterium]